MKSESSPPSPSRQRLRRSRLWQVYRGGDVARKKSHMSVIAIESLDDPRLAPYRALKERELARHGGRFIAESEQIVRRLIESQVAVESVLVARRRAEEIVPIVPPHVPVYVVPDERVEQIIGF